MEYISWTSNNDICRCVGITRAQYERLPAVCLYAATAAEPFPTITFNFAGPFVFPIPDHDAYSYGIQQQQQPQHPKLAITIQEASPREGVE